MSRLKVRPLSEEENKVFKDFFKPIVGNLSKSYDSNTISTMFNYNNNIYPFNKDHSKSCGACRFRVYTRLLEYYNSLPSLEVEPPKVEINEVELKKSIKKK